MQSKTNKKNTLDYAPSFATWGVVAASTAYIKKFGQ